MTIFKAEERRMI